MSFARIRIVSNNFSIAPSITMSLHWTTFDDLIFLLFVFWFGFGLISNSFEYFTVTLKSNRMEIWILYWENHARMRPTNNQLDLVFHFFSLLSFLFPSLSLARSLSACLCLCLCLNSFFHSGGEMCFIFWIAH